MGELIIALGLIGGAFLIARALMRSQDVASPQTCDLRRSIVIVGPEQNSPECVTQRRALKPLIMRLRNTGINIVEIYGGRTPRRNGQVLEWLDSDALRRSLRARSGFHLICLDNEAEIILHGRRAVSNAVLTELVAGEERPALPSPGAEPDKDPAGSSPKGDDADSSWSVGVLR